MAVGGDGRKSPSKALAALRPFLPLRPVLLVVYASHLACAMEQPPPVSPRPSAFGSTLKTNLDGFITSAVLNTPAPSTRASHSLLSELPLTPEYTATKEPLSLGVTSTNFRRFVQKSGPLFLAQDAVVDVLSWADPAKTMLFGAVWALLCTASFPFSPRGC